MRANEKRELLNGLGFVGLWIVGLSVFTLYPVLASLFYSFSDFSVLEPPLWIGMGNYERLLHDSVFWTSLKNTLIYTVLSLPLGMLVSISLALLLNTGVRGMALFRTFFYLPSLVPLVASAMLWLWIFNGNHGILNVALRPLVAVFGAEPPAWLADPNWSKPALALMSAWGVGNSIVIYLAGLQDVPQELYESAELDGAGFWRRVWHVTFADDFSGYLFQPHHGADWLLAGFHSGVCDDGWCGWRAGALYALLCFVPIFDRLL